MTTITELPVDEIELNDDLISTPNSFVLKDLNPDHKHYKSIVHDFKNVPIKSIQKVQNYYRQKEYMNKKETMQQERGRPEINPQYKLNERYLYHGFSSSETNDILANGLEDKLAKDGCFGRGIYFSDDVRKCQKYANRRDGNEGLILCVRVILGDAKIYENGKRDQTLKREPQKTPGGTSFKFHCSVQGRPSGFNEFVVYRSSQTLIEYLITYSKTTSDDRGPSPVASSSKTTDASQDSDSASHSDSEEQSGKDTDTSDDTDTDKETTSEDDTEDEKEEEKEEIDPARKREIFIEKTTETDDSVIDSFLIVTSYDLEIAIYLYTHKDEIQKEVEKICAELESGENQATDATLTFHPENAPHYGSKEWTSLQEEKQYTFIEEFLLIFMSAVALNQEHRSFAKEYLVKNDYDIDNTIRSYYFSI